MNGLRKSPGKLWPRLALVGAAVAATLAVVLVPTLLRQGTDAPASAAASPSAAPTRTDSPSLLPNSSQAPSASPVTPISADLLWTETGSFGSGDAFEFASAVVRSANGFVSVGTHYTQPLDPSGPLPPHEGRIWLSPDGHSWTEVTPPGTFADAVMEHVFTTMDGSLIAIGKISNPDLVAGDEFLEPLAAWQSTDGRDWERIETGLPAEMTVQRLVGGARGYIAALWNYTGGLPQLWLSTDGRRWEQTYAAGDDEQLTDIGAGDQGFVAVGQRGAGDGPDAFSTFVIASSDGRDWIESSSPPTDVYRVAPTGPDWIATGLGPGFDSATDSATDAETPLWFSANGLNWREVGNLRLEWWQLDGGGACREFVAELIGAGGWLLVGTAFSFPCSEGGVVGYGNLGISVDGASWEALPFPGFSYIRGGGREDGSIVIAASATDTGLVLVGQSNGRATFWFGEPR